MIWKTLDFRLISYTESVCARCLKNKKAHHVTFLVLVLVLFSVVQRSKVPKTLSSSKTKYTAATASVCQGVWLIRIHTDIYQEKNWSNHNLLRQLSSDY